MKNYTFLAVFLFFIIGVNAQIINFPDANFKARLLAADTSYQIAKDLSGNWFKIDANNDGEIEVSEAIQVYQLYISSSLISSLEGISNFSNLNELSCQRNTLAILDLTGLNNLRILFCYENQLSSLDFTGLNNLIFIDCSFNSLTTLNLTGLNNLEQIYCGDNQLTSLYFTGLSNIFALNCPYNSLTNLDLTGLTNLYALDCSFNQFTDINLTGLNNLKELFCGGNQLTTLDTSGLNILFLECQYNQLTTLDLTGLNNLSNVLCGGNQLSTIEISELNNINDFNCDDSSILSSISAKNNSSYISGLSFSNCPNLEYICVADSKIVMVQNNITTYGYTNCTVNSYCSFTPGGLFYTIQGNNRFDSNNNGCDTADIPASNLKFNITDGTNSGSLISDSSGAYHIDVQAGTHTITPALENPTYFTVSPATVNVTFPTQASPFTQDFCVTANGVHPDLEVTLLPIGPARPGFDANYKIIYKNKGNQTQSGSVNLTFDDAVLDFVTATPATTTQATNSLTWDFVNLAPFETREISFTLNVNSPMETPAVNQDDILNFTATINSPATDETPNDNTIAFNQIVVNSLDPNDKTCIEGTTITPAMVGEYVHYVIRFENTGTFPAENIVVKDLIDTAKFDINTLISTKGSHEFVTKISETNKVEFIFENINLPFDDANNDGFVAFKIKTKSSLVLGDTFSNSANIYFDYNFPIVTNTATTTVQTLGKSDFEFAKYFTVYPNPTSSVLNLSTKSGISVNSIGIYNILGQLVIAIPNAQSVSNIDVSNLKAGNYFIKMTTDKGISNSKFIKN